MLIDKSYFDYDYERPPKKIDVNIRRPSMSSTKLNDTLSRFGVGVKAPKEMSMEELQDYARRDAGIEND